MEARGAVPELIAALKEDRPRSEEGERRHSARVSSAAITALAGLGAGAVEPLVQVLASGDREAIPSAFQALGRIGPRAAPALPHFIEQALSAGRELRNDALLSLPGLGPAARPAVPVLAAACRAPTPVWMQTNSIQVLGRLGPEATAAAPALREILASPVSEARPDYLQREAAAALIRILPGDPEPQRFLAAALADRSLENRSRIANQLGEALEPVTETVQALGQALVDGDEGIHYPAVESLRRFGPAAKEALPGLIEALHDAWDLFRTEALLTIASLGPEGKDAVPALAEIMTADDGRDARTAAFALHEIRNDLDRVLPQLLEAAARSNPWAVKALGHAGPEPRSLELLREMVDLRKPAGKPDPLLCAAAESLFRLGHHPEQMARILAVQLRLPEDPATGTSPDDGSVRRSYPARQDIARTLGELGPGAIGAEAALEEAAVDADDPLLRLRAVEALYRITAREEAAVPRLVELLERFGWYLQGEPARVLGDLEARAAAAVPALVSALGDRHTVASSYQYPTIYVQPEDRHVSPRARVARALGRIGKPAAAAVPALREALDDGDRELRQEAAAALERILR
jgi:HEAT repeat protein